MKQLCELSLFSGAGGGLLASKILNWRTLGYVENNNYCQRILAARMQDGYLDKAPIFGDIRTFNSEGYAESYQGMVDVVSAGFPCQPFSSAGKKRGADDPRNMWPETWDTIRLVRPRFAFLENVSGLISGKHGYFGVILADLAALGYDLRWTVLSAANCGAPHLRKRLWIVASDASSTELRHESRGSSGPDRQGTAEPRHNGAEGYLADAPRVSEREQTDQADTVTEGRYTRKEPCGGGTGTAALAIPESVRGGSPGENKGRPQGANRANGGRDAVSGWWATEPDVGRVADGVANRVDRLRALGNGQVSIVAATAWRLLTQT